MATRRVVVQAGHCFRKTGRTGTIREQEFAWAVGTRVKPLLEVQGHKVSLILADDPVPPAHIFFSLHLDGTADGNGIPMPTVHGASVGYPDNHGKQLASIWKRAHQRNGYPFGFLTDNYTAALAGYYGFGRAQKVSPACVCFLAEHGHATGKGELDWLFSHLDQCARAHAEAIAEFTGVKPKEGGHVVAPQYDPPFGPIAATLKDPQTGGVWLGGPDGALYAVEGAPAIRGANEKPYFVGRILARLELSPDGRPVIVATSGERYGPDF